GTNTVLLDAAHDRVMVLLHQVAFSDVIGSAFSAEDEQAVETHPVIYSPRVTSRRVGELGRTRNWLRLRGSASIEDLCVVDSHVGLLSCLCVANFRRGLCIGTADKLVNVGLSFQEVTHVLQPAEMVWPRS